MQITIIGAGYVGLVSAACFAEIGHRVVCADQDSTKIAALKCGRIGIFEPDLAELVARNMDAGRLSFTGDIAANVPEADAVFIAVGTPSRRSDGHADLSQVYAAVRQIAPALNGFTVVVTKSTVPVGSGDELERFLRALRPDADFAVAANPEFLREGSAIRDFQHPDRIVVGAHDPRAQEVLAAIYRPLGVNGTPILHTSRRTAELIKYTANAFLATKITFINEIADLCEKLGADVREVAHGIGLDHRIGASFLRPGPGVGGSCLPKDALALIKTAQDHETPLRIVETVLSVNELRKRAMARKVAEALGGGLRGATVGVLGLTFKANTDDMRDAPSIALILGLQDMGASVRAYDPAGMEQAKPLLDGVAFACDAYACAEGADVVAVATEWEEFLALDLARLRRVMRQPVVVDLRNVCAPAEMARHGFVYHGLGVPSPKDGG